MSFAAAFVQNEMKSKLRSTVDPCPHTGIWDMGSLEARYMAFKAPREMVENHENHENLIISGIRAACMRARTGRGRSLIRRRSCCELNAVRHQCCSVSCDACEVVVGGVSSSRLRAGMSRTVPGSHYYLRSLSRTSGTFSRFSEDFLGRERGGSLGDPPGP